MPRQQPELGTKSPYRLRLGQQIDRFRGINREADPGAIRDDELQDARNIRLTASGQIVPRGGKAKVNASAMSGCVEGLIDDEDPTIATIFAGVDGSGAQHIFKFPISLREDAVAAGDGTLGSPRGTYLNQGVYVRTSGGQRQVSALSLGEVKTSLFNLDSATYQIPSSSAELGTNLFVAVGAGGTATLFKWDGTTNTVEDTVGPAPLSAPTDVIVRSGEVYWIADESGSPGTGVVRRRTSAGAWSNYVSYSGLPESLDFLTYYSVDGHLYAVVNSHPPVRIYRITSGAVTLVNTITGAGFNAWAQFNGYLYYLLYDPSLGGFTLGRFNGTTWDNTYKVAPFDDDGLNSDAASIIAAGPNLVALRDVGGVAAIHASTGTDTTTWRSIETTAFSIGSGVVLVEP